MKKSIVILLFALVVSGLFAQHMLYVPLQNSTLIAPVAGDVTFNAYITTRPGEVLTETGGGSGWNVGIGYVEVQCADFPTMWAIGELVHIDVIETSSGQIGSGEYALVGGSYTFIAEPLILETEVPVTLSNFSAAVFANEFVEISWTTESEQGSQGFNIYRGTTNDLATSTQLNYALISGAGSSTELIDYSYMDEGVLNNTTYWYWLESVSNDETVIHNPITLTVEFDEDPTPEFPNQTELIGNHPNPFNPSTFINFNVKENETATLSIFNTKGQLVMNRTFEPGFHNYNWQADSNPSGVYFYKLQSESITTVKKMLLLK